MSLRELVVSSTAPYQGGQSFGRYGPFEQVNGVARFAVDPAAAPNVRITDLDRAERAGDGTVQFEADVCIVRPATERPRGVLFVVANRGLLGGLPFSTGLVRTFGAVDSEVDAGDGFVLRQGWAVAWCGWQWDVRRRPGVVGIDAPQAVDGGHPIEGTVRVEFRPDRPVADHVLADAVLPIFAFQGYPVAGGDDPDGVLTVHDWPDGPKEVIDRGRWRFARDDDGRPVADDGHIWLEGGFDPHRFYEVIYRTGNCPVAGTGLLAIRDFVSHLRATGGFEHTIAYGASQSARVLRQFIHEGLNVGEDGRQVFDGVLGHIGGGRLGEFNHRYAQPSVTSTAGFGFLPPFATDDLYGRQRTLGGVPRTVFTNSSWEYWRGDAALSHVTTDGTADLPDPEYARSYHFAGTDHIGDMALLKDSMAVTNPTNPLDSGLLLRAAFVNLEAWVCDGVQPPPSRVPRVADGTAVSRPEALAAAVAVPGAGLPDGFTLPAIHRLDLGPEADRGVGRWPVVQGEPYPVLVSAVDDDGNETAGVRLPHLAVPLATHTAWNPRVPVAGLPAVLLEFAGSMFPFPRTADERTATGDPRPAIAERYADRDDYLDRARKVAAELVAERYLLVEDEDAVVDQAARLYDRLTADQ